MNSRDVEKAQDALQNIESLIDEVSKDYFIPKRFRKAPFTKDIKNAYLEYLEEEAGGLRDRINGVRKISPVSLSQYIVVSTVLQ